MLCSRRTIRTSFIGLLLVCFAVLPTLSSQAASPPNLLTYQGRLLDSNGTPVSSASVSVIFELYTAVSGGTCVWSNSSASCASATSRTVTLTDGLFSEDLGDTTIGAPYAAIGDSIFGDNSALFLQVTIEGEALSPRKQITASPYAMNSDTLDGYNTSTSGGTSSFVPTTDASGNLVLTGDPTGTTVSTGVVYVNPTTASATETLLGLAVGGVQSLRVTGDGDIETRGSLTFSDDGETISIGTTTIQTGGVSDTGTLSLDGITGIDLNVGDNGVINTGTGLFTMGGNLTVNGTAFTLAGNGTILDMTGTGTLGLNTTTNRAITTGTGLFTTGGNLQVNGTTALGDADADTITLNGNAVNLAGSAPIIDSTAAALGLNTTTNLAINTGTGNFDIGGHTAIGGSASASTTSLLLLSESLSCASGCQGVSASITNTAGPIATDAAGGNFRISSPLGTSATINLVGIAGGSVATGAVDFDGPLIGASGSVSGSAAATLSDAYGVSGITTLNALADVTGRAVGVAGSVRSSNGASFSGTVDALYGTFAPSAGTYAIANGLEIGITGSGGTITAPTGASITLSPIGGVLFSPAGNTTGLKIDVSGENTSGDDALNVYGANIVATGGTTGAGRSAYGVRATATGADSNYSGYFYGALFQVDDDATVNTTNALATGAGDIYAVGDIEADGDIRLDGGDLSVRTASGNAKVDVVSGDANGYAVMSLAGIDGGGTAGNWQNYTSGGTAAAVNGAQSDLLWNTAGTVDGNAVMRLKTTGELFLDVSVGVGAADVAEVYQVADMTLVAGDIVGITSTGDLVKGDTASGVELFGVVSTAPGITLNNGEDDEITSNERPIALVGRVPVKVNLEGGIITAGDPIALSSTSGVGMKAVGPGMIVGFALESYVGEGDSIDVFTSLQWNSAGMIVTDGSAVGVNTDLVVNALSEATSSTPTVDSSSLVLRGSAFDVSAVDRSFSMATAVTNTTDYRLSIKNTIDTEVAYLGQDGAFSVAGDVIVGDHLYPSDRGTAQTNRYIFYDGSEGPGGDFMRTNASGWATGSYDFAEMFPSSDALKPGDVVAFGTKKEEVVRASGDARERLAGVVSTRPGFLAGENKVGDYPIALAGRVPTVVSGEGGEIQVGDALTISSVAGVAKKAEAPGMIIGYALEDFSGTSGTIVVYINTTYWNGSTQSANNQASGLNGSALSSLSAGGDVYIGANNILNVASISGIGQRWSIGENGDLRTEGTLATSIEGYNGDRVDTYASTSSQITISLSGQAELQDGKVMIDLVKEDQNFLNVVSNLVPLRILTTPSAPIAVYVSERTPSGFIISQVNGSSSGVMVDWYVIGVRKGFEPASYLEIETPGIPVEPDVEESDLTAPLQDVTEEVVTEPTSEDDSGVDPFVTTEEEEIIPDMINESPIESISEEVEGIDEPASDVETSTQPSQIQAETPEVTEVLPFVESSETDVIASESAPAVEEVVASPPSEDLAN